MTAEKNYTNKDKKLEVNSKSGQTEVTVKIENPPLGHKSVLQERVDKELDKIEKKLKGK